jgi:hypothetical protein
MNARTNLITAALTLALIGPAAAGASMRNIPADASLPTKQSAVHLHTLKANTSTTGKGAYNGQAYVYGGASTKVAKAITGAGKRPSITTYSQWAYVPGGASQKVAKAITIASRPR